jgi:hypothetical protein
MGLHYSAGARGSNPFDLVENSNGSIKFKTFKILTDPKRFFPCLEKFK